MKYDRSPFKYTRDTLTIGLAAAALTGCGGNKPSKNAEPSPTPTPVSKPIRVPAGAIDKGIGTMYTPNFIGLVRTFEVKDTEVKDVRCGTIVNEFGTEYRNRVLTPLPAGEDATQVSCLMNRNIPRQQAVEYNHTVPPIITNPR